MTGGAHIADDARPRLAAKVRLRFDRHSQKHMLVFPDRGMELNPSAARIAELCTGEHTVAEIVTRMAAATSGTTADEIARDVRAFLGALRERALLELDRP